MSLNFLFFSFVLPKLLILFFVSNNQIPLALPVYYRLPTILFLSYLLFLSFFSFKLHLLLSLRFFRSPRTVYLAHCWPSLPKVHNWNSLVSLQITWILHLLPKYTIEAITFFIKVALNASLRVWHALILYVAHRCCCVQGFHQAFRVCFSWSYHWWALSNWF